MVGTLIAIKYEQGTLQILDQLLLPETFVYVDVKDTVDAWNAIKTMKVRGAPAIAIVGCLGLIVELKTRLNDFSTATSVCDFITNQLQYLVTARPTAVNMKEAACKLSLLVKEMSTQKDITVEQVVTKVTDKVEEMLEKDVADNKSIGKHGANSILQRCNNKPVSVLTHCNTGSLATAGYGTALGIIRSLHEQKRLEHVYCTETRPYNQGSRLTAYEIFHEQMPGTLICDSMVAMLMKSKKISAVVVGADRVVANGDTANKIGTYQLAVVAKYHGIPFYVAAPSTSCDMDLPNGEKIVIEERSPKEITRIKDVPIAPEGINCWNPAFDVTPAELITGGIVTEYGVFSPAELKSKLDAVPNKKRKIEA